MMESIKRLFESIMHMVRLVVIFLLALVIISPIVGTVFVFFDWHWGIGALVANIILALILSFFIWRAGILQIETIKECLSLAVVTAICFCIYFHYSPVLYLAQDPAIYMLKALNLVNYGHTYKPMLTYNYMVDNGIISALKGYGNIQNGTYFRTPNLYADFFPGGSFFYSLFGLISKDIIFYAQTAIMIINSWLMYFAIKKLAGLRNSIVIGVYTLTFMLAPVIVWFGRGSFTEPSALLFFLLLINILSTASQPPVLLAICFLASYSARIDYLLVMLLGVFIVLYIDYKTGVAYTLAVICQIYLYKKSYEFYLARIVRIDMPLLRYSVPMVLVIFISSSIFIRWKKEMLLKFFYSKWVKYLVIGLGIASLCLMFYDNVLPAENYSTAWIHKQMLRTYEEEILDLLFLVFPSMILSLGLVGMYSFIDKERINFTTSIFVLGFGIVYLYLLLGSSNSPQLYWVLRRYYNNIIPVSMLSFCCLFNNLHKNQEYLLAGTCMALSFNMFLNSGQIVDYDGLDKSVINMEREIKNRGYNRVYYLTETGKEVSPLFAYSNLDFVPLTHADYILLSENRESYDLSNSLFLIDKDVEGIDKHVYELSYLKLGENYGEVPKEIYERKVELSGYNLREYMDRSFNSIYPYGFVDQVTGIYDDGWTMSEAEIVIEDFDIKDNSEMVIEIQKYGNWFIGNIDELNLRVSVNDDYLLKPIGYEENKFRFSLNDLKQQGEKIENIKIFCNTFCPAVVKRSGDTRELGIALKEIYVQ